MRFEETDLYPVITPELCAGRDPLAVLLGVLKGGARIVQLRDKKDPERYAANFRRLTKKYGALFFVNDDLDLALRSGADGLHIGQGDISLFEVKRRAPRLMVGVSINTWEEAREAEEGGADYLTIGVAFPTKSKLDVKVVTGLELIREIAPQLRIPFVAIGGINRENIGQLLAIGVRHIAMITALSEAPDVEKATRELIDLVKNYPLTKKQE